MRAELAVAVMILSMPAVAQQGAAGGTTGMLGLRPVENPAVITLDDAFQRAAAQSLDLRITQGRIAESNAQVSKAWAFLLPSLSLGADYTRNVPEQTVAFASKEQNQQQALLFSSLADITAASAAQNPDPLARRAALERAEALRKSADSIANAPITEIAITPANVVNGNLTFAMPLFNARSLPLLQNAYAGAQITKLAADQARNSILFNTARAYFQVVAAKSIVEIATAQVASSTRHAELARRRLEEGMLTTLAASRAELDVQRAEQQMKQATAGLRAAKAGLGAFLGVVEDFDVTAPAPIEGGPETASVDELLTRAFSSRTDLLVQKEALAIADRGRTDAWMRFMPSFQLVAQGRYTSNTSGFTSLPFTGLLMVQGSLPIFDGGMTLATIAEANAKVSQEVLKTRQVEENVEREVRGTVEDLAVKKDAVVMAERLAELAEQQAENAAQLFEAGAATQTDVSDARLFAFSAKVDLARARLDLESARLGLSWAIGELDLAKDVAPAPLTREEEQTARSGLDAVNAR